jgi:signal transduction histidine kinase
MVRERRADAARSAAELAGRAVAEERLRIARELHDVVAHSMSLIAVKAGTANHVMAVRPEEAQDALRVIETTSRSALAEMRQLLGVLRAGPVPQTSPAPAAPATAPAPAAPPAPPAPATSPVSGRGLLPPAASVQDEDAPLPSVPGVAEHGAPDASGAPGAAGLDGAWAAVFGIGPADLAPQPGMAGLPALAERAEQAGVPVELEVRGVDRLPEGVALSVYRIVQEALTNVVRHAAPASCRVAVVGERDEVRVEVIDDGPGQRVLPVTGRTGHGLIGMRERVLMYGGEFHAGPRVQGGFGVSARIPCEP